MLTVISCNDSFWDLNFVIKRSGNTVGDKVTFFIQNSAGRMDLFSFTIEATGVRLTSTIRSLTAGDRSLTGSFGMLGDFVDAGELVSFSGDQTPVLTFAFFMHLMDCRQLGLEIMRGSGVGTTSVAFADVVLIRSGGATGMGQGIRPNGTLDGEDGSYPTGLVCPVVCVPCRRLCFCGDTGVRASGDVRLIGNQACLSIMNDSTGATTGTITNIGFALPGTRPNNYVLASSTNSNYFIAHDLKATSGAQLFVDEFDFVLHNKSGGNPTFGGGSVANGIAPGDSAKFLIMGDFTMLTLSELASGIYPRFQAVNGNDSDVSRLCPCEP